MLTNKNNMAQNTKTPVLRKGGYDITKPDQMTALSKTLKGHVVKHALYAPIQGKNYVMVEGWQFAGGMMGLYPIVTNVEDISDSKKQEVKWRADVDLINMATGNVVGRGSAVCSNKENKKKTFDEYAICSMAQTRAIGKAYRNTIGWVMKLAGYEGTPGEEILSVGDTPPPAQEQTKQTPKQENIVEYLCHGATKAGGCGASITRQEYDYSKKVYGKAMCRQCQKQATPIKKKATAKK